MIDDFPVDGKALCCNQIDIFHTQQACNSHVLLHLNAV